MSRLLIVDDEKNMREMLRDFLDSQGHEAVVFGDAEGGLAALEREAFDAAIVDLNLPGISGIELLRRVRERGMPMPVIMITAYGTIDTAVDAIKQGAHDFIVKPFELARIQQTLRNCIESVKLVSQANLSGPEFEDARGKRVQIVGDDAKLRHIFEMVNKIARAEAAVLIRGESGTGKELVAQAIHYNGLRKDGAFIAVNCSALTETLLESEFFGHERGAFTGAHSIKKGKFELADGGTIFLDEIGDMPLATQVKLLRALQERSFMRVGGEKEIHVDVRVIAATNRDLEAAVADGEFREDLYFRLNVVSIRLPALRERRGDIPKLVEFFIRRSALKNNLPALRVGEELMDRIKSYDWRGNIRELENTVEKATILGDPDLIAPVDLSLGPAEEGEERAASGDSIALPEGDITLADARNHAEREAIIRALRRSSGNKLEAARILGISNKTLYNKIGDLGIRLSVEVH